MIGILQQTAAFAKYDLWENTMFKMRDYLKINADEYTVCVDRC